VRRAELSLRLRRIEAAVGIFTDQVWPGSAPEATRTGLLSRIGVAMPDLVARRDFLAGLLRGHADDRFVLLKQAALAFRERDRAVAERCFDAARGLGPLPLESQLLELELHLAATRFDAAFALAGELCARHPDRADFARRRIQAAHFTGRHAEMVALVADALQRWPRDWLLAFRYNRCTISMADDRMLFELLARNAAAMAADERWQFQFAIACLRHGETARAIGILHALSETGAVAPMMLPLRAALMAYPAATWANPRGIDNDPEKDVQIIRVPGAIATVMLHAGMQGGLGYLPFTHADGLLARRPVNVVYLRDLNTRAFGNGVRGLGLDQASTIAALRRIGATLGVPVVTMGASIGGVAAIRTATLMGAHAAISFAGMMHLGTDNLEEPAPGLAGSTRATLFSNFGATDLSLVDMIRAAPGTHVHQCFGADYPPDIESAALLNGLPNATLHPLAGCADHFVIEHLIVNGGFFDVLQQAIEP
jgi:hypothetical protein